MGVFLAICLLPSCTISRYEIRNKLSGHGPQAHGQPCDIKYSLLLASQSRTPRHEVRESDEYELNELRDKYTQWTNAVLRKKGCAAAYVEKEAEANFKVRVERWLNLDTLLQEHLTSVSLGVIPSWGTRPGQYVYVFEDMKAKARHTYIIDKKFYHHVIFFPVFWLQWLTLDEFKIYEKVLGNFIDGS